MSTKVTLGGDRLGTGKKMKQEMHGYGRSTFDQSHAFKSSMSPGVLVPFLINVGTTGTTFDIDVNMMMRTIPTIQPLYGSFKLQADLFSAPIRLYNRQLHNNELNIGLNIEKVQFPIIEYRAKGFDKYKTLNPNNQQVNPSSLCAYNGVMGLGQASLTTEGGSLGEVKREINATPTLMYWEILKNYYSNKQEEYAFVISGNAQEKGGYYKRIRVNSLKSKEIGTKWGSSPKVFDTFDEFNNWTKEIGGFVFGADLEDEMIFEGVNLDPFKIYRSVPKRGKRGEELNNGEYEFRPAFFHWRDGLFTENLPNNDGFRVLGDNCWFVVSEIGWESRLKYEYKYETRLERFPLENIDKMRDKILEQPKSSPLKIEAYEKNSPAYNEMLPYSASNYVQRRENGELTGDFGQLAPMGGLAVKTYQSDRFNNWLSKEYIDGANGISELTSVDVSDGKLNLDALNIAQKVYNMLNRIMVSGGTYKDYLESVYGYGTWNGVESPVYHGSCSSEIEFEEVVSTANTEYGNLGELGGRGSAGKNGNVIRIKVDEPSYIMGIVSITPRLDYSQGNEWWTRLKTMNDLHKPELDGIGFQELLTDEFAAFDTIADAELKEPVYKSVGKQTAYIEYQTAVNRCYGTFAEENNTMSMTLNRNYQYDARLKGIADATTYIDPTKYNYAFADTNLDAQNFWLMMYIVQKTRRVMSARQIPNL